MRLSCALAKAAVPVEDLPLRIVNLLWPPAEATREQRYFALLAAPFFLDLCFYLPAAGSTSTTLLR
jgi:hypothetical protein